MRWLRVARWPVVVGRLTLRWQYFPRPRDVWAPTHCSHDPSHAPFCTLFRSALDQARANERADQRHRAGERNSWRGSGNSKHYLHLHIGATLHPPHLLHRCPAFPARTPSPDHLPVVGHGLSVCTDCAMVWGLVGWNPPRATRADSGLFHAPDHTDSRSHHLLMHALTLQTHSGHASAPWPNMQSWRLVLELFPVWTM